jgi:hypothetical protein
MMDDRPTEDEAPTDRVPAGDPVPPAAGWVAPTDPGAGPPARPASRVSLIVAWIGALILVVLVGLIRYRSASDLSAYELGRALGTFLVPIVVALIIRWIFVRVTGGGPVLRSLWTPLLTIALAGGLFAATLASLAPVDPTPAMRVAAPYTLEDPDQATLDQITTGLRQEGFTGPIVVRMVHGADGSTSVLYAMDSRVSADDLDEIARGMTKDTGQSAVIESIAGTDVAISVSPDAAFADWVEAPLLVSVVAADEVTLRAVVEAVLTAPR